eukprot:6995069-Ditylum_brightwellii.AAC.1
MQILRNVRNWKKKTKEKFGIKIPEDTEEALLIDERNGDSKRTTYKTAVCIQVYISWIEERTLANNQIKRGNYWLSTNEEGIPRIPVPKLQEEHRLTTK